MANMQKGSPMYQMKGLSKVAQPVRMGDSDIGGQMSFMPNVREVNQMKTANQVQNYANSKQMFEQGRTEMRGNVVGYSGTLG